MSIKTGIKIIQYILLTVFCTVVLSGAWFVLTLFFSAETGFLVYVISLLFLLLCCLVVFVTKKISRAFMVILSVLLAVSFLGITAGNALVPRVSEYFYDKPVTSAQDKWALYKDFFSRMTASPVSLDSYEKKKSGNMVYYKKASLTPERMADADEGVAEARSFYQKMLGTPPDSPVSVVFLSDFEVLETDNGVQIEFDGAYSPKENRIYINLPEEEGDEERYFQSILAHEYTHFLFQNYIEEHGLLSITIPVWLDEGLAETAERMAGGRPMDTKILLDGQFASFKDLESVGGWNAHLSDPYNPYAQSSLFIDYLAGKEGSHVWQQIFQAMKEDVPFNQAFESVTGRSFASYEKECMKDLQTAADLWDQLYQISDRTDSRRAELAGKIHKLFPQEDAARIIGNR